MFDGTPYAYLHICGTPWIGSEYEPGQVPPFGTIKARMGATHFLMKTLPRVASEMALHVLAYNLTRVMNIIGIQPLITAMRHSINPENQRASPTSTTLCRLSLGVSTQPRPQTDTLLDRHTSLPTLRVFSRGPRHGTRDVG
jgi:transposase